MSRRPSAGPALWTLYTSIQIHHQAPEGVLTVPDQLHLLPTSPMVPGAAFQPTRGSSVPALAGVLFSSPLSSPDTQKNFEFSLYIIHLVADPQDPFAPFWCPWLASCPDSSFDITIVLMICA